MKKFISIFMVLAVILSLGITAAAEENDNGTIKITNATIDETYKIYKLFDAIPTEDGTGVSYMIDPEKENALFKALFGEDGTTTNPYFTYTASNYVSKPERVNDAEVVKYLTDLVLGDGTNPGVTINFVKEKKEVQDSEVVFEDLPYGYYLISSSLGAVVTLDSNTPDVTVIDKNQKPGVGLDKQVVTGAVDDVLNPENKGQFIFSDSNSANIGDLITYKVSFNATNYDGDEQVNYYQINDVKGKGIWVEFNSFRVFVGGKELKKGYYLPVGNVDNTGEWKFLGDWTDLDEDESEWDRDDADWYLVHLGYDEFRISIPWKSEHSITGDETAELPGPYSIDYKNTSTFKYASSTLVEVYYEAAVESEATIGVSDNTTNLFNSVYVSWGTAHDVYTTDADRVITYTYGFGIVKEDAADHANLPGAKFKLYYDKELKKPIYVIPTNIEGVYILDSLGSPADGISGLAMADSRDLYGSEKDGGKARLDKYLNGANQRNEVVSPVNGRIVILGLAEGEYYVEEFEAPFGYNPISKPLKIVVGEDLTNFTIFADSEGNVKDIVQPENGFTEYHYNISHTVIQNSKGAELPSTGGEGTFWMITIGTLMAIGFAVFLITHKKMSIYTD